MATCHLYSRAEGRAGENQLEIDVESHYDLVISTDPVTTQLLSY